MLMMTTLAVAASGCAGARNNATPTTSHPAPAIPAMGNPTTGPVGPLTAPGGPFLDDRYGRVILMHGVNLVYKVPPYEVEVNGAGPNVLTVPEVQRMASLGFDVVRLGILWKGLEPGTAPMNDPAICTRGTPRASGPNQFNPSVFNAYLTSLDATVSLLGRYGISSLIDMHQDVYNEVFGGEGAPDWAVCTDGVQPKPKLNVPDWSVNLQGPGVETAYGHFWNNDVVGNLQGEFDSIWARVAAHFRGNPWVIGYDPCNEPYGPGVVPYGTGVSFDARLQCFYAGRGNPGVSQSGTSITCPPHDPKVGVIPRIEAADPNHLVFYEGNYTTDSGPLNHIGPMPLPRLALNFHDYCFLHVPNGPEAPDYSTVCAPSENLVFNEHSSERLRDSTSEQPGGPAWLLTEFGATTDATDLGRITADADSHLVGWIYWEWLNYDDPTGSLTSGLWPPSEPTQSMLQILSRTYPLAIAGSPIATSFDTSSGRFTLDFRANSRITEPTVIFVPVALHYSHGYCAIATGAHVSSAPDASYVDVVNEGKAADVTITITPGSC